MGGCGERTYKGAQSFSNYFEGVHEVPPPPSTPLCASTRYGKEHGNNLGLHF